MNDKKKTNKPAGNPGGGDLFYALGWLGALVYYIQQAEGAGQIVLGILKSLVWPAFFVYDVLRLLAQ